MYYAVRHTMIRLLHHLIEVETHSSFVKDCIGGNSASDVEERDVNDYNDDMQGDLSTGYNCEEFQADDSMQNKSDLDSAVEGTYINVAYWVIVASSFVYLLSKAT